VLKLISSAAICFFSRRPATQHLDLSRNLLAKNIEQIQQWPEGLCSLNLSGNRFGADAVRLPAFPPRLQARLDISLPPITSHFVA
jgi:hypothetical protein